MEQPLRRNFVLVLLIILVSYISGHKGCFEEERKGLLELKEVMGFMNQSSIINNELEFLLSDWVDDEVKNECCEWSQVTCNHITGHVIKISLGEMYRSSSMYSWSLNLSLFIPFKELRSLNLSYTNIDGWTKSEGLTSLHRLEILDLSWNNFGGSIPSFIWELSTLKALRLTEIRFDGSLHNQGFASLHHLEILDLAQNYIGGSIPSFIWSLSSLKALSLSWTQVNGSLPMQGFCELNKLQELDFSYNNLEGTLPPCLSNLTSLKLLDLSHNRLIGNIYSTLIASLVALEYIDLSYNHFEGLFSFSLFANHSNLQVVEIRNDNTKFEVETESVDWIPMFQLRSLVLSNCNLNKLFGVVPKFLFHQQKLKVLDLSGNQLDGRFPSWLLENNTELQILCLRNNSFGGMFHLPLPSFRNLSAKWMDISNNHFNGRIQANIGQMLPYVYYLNLSRNDFHNGVPSSIGDMSELMHLDLSVNNFSGEFPNQVATGCTSLSQLVLSHNMFHGEFPLTQFNATQMSLLKLDNNHFIGKLSNDFTGFNNLFELDISNNFFSGAIPYWISKCSSILVLRNNCFEGQISHLPFDAIFIDFSYNSLTGSLPPFTKNMFLEHIHLQGNKFTGSIPESYVDLSSLLTLDLSDNNLSGNIPKFIGALPSLRILILGGNYFSGAIPDQLCQLRNISLMDLSNNSLSGSIPKCLPNITGPSNLAFSRGNSIGFFTGKQAFHIYERNLTTYINNYMNRYQLNYADFSEILDEVGFRTKGRPRSYKGSILDLMTGLDLSCNNLTGEIPIQMGMLVQIRALNLSHNQLSGPIPKLFSHLAQMESLDLSFNNLSGEIPLQLVDLTFLAVFIVAYNNLSGRIPEMKAQFGTFPKESYEGNPFLCGPQVEKNCTTTTLVTSSSPTASSDHEGEEKWYEIDIVFFCASFVATYFVFLLGAATLLYINPYWRRRWFTLVEECMYSFYYFICDFIRK